MNQQAHAGFDFLVEGKITGCSVVICVVIMLVKVADNNLALAAGSVYEEVVTHVDSDVIRVPVSWTGEENEIADSQLAALNIGVLSILAGAGAGGIIAIVLEYVGSEA